MLCSLIIKDSAKRGRTPDPNVGQYLGIFDKLFLMVELELVRLAIASPGFTISFQGAYDHFNANRREKASIRRHLRNSVFFAMEKCNVFFLKPEYINYFVDF